ncbi:MAG TPA: Tol-Pal system beta propeller repeat protein TolB [Thermodesulfovibrionales bacterium]|nr:Tol-Pal system beta propeller repeat protein TolB [Thermodesulfovibrionales bacterium]
MTRPGLIAQALFTVFVLLVSRAGAKIYIDVTSPAFKKLPIAIAEFSGQSGREISDIIRDDLDFSGLFQPLDRSAFIEGPSQPFQVRNWSVLGAEIVVKGIVTGDKEKTTIVSLYDVMEGQEIFRKAYQTDASLTRPLAHTIANDIYRQITGQPGIFRSRIAYVTRYGSHDELTIADWDGQRAYRPGVKGTVLLSPRWTRDASRLVYSSERNRQWEIYLLDFRKRSERVLFSAKGTNLAGDFLPDGDQFLLSSSTGGTPDIYKYRISESKLTRLTSSRSVDVSPAASPDGSLIAFVSDRQGSPQIFIMGTDGYDIRRLTFSGSYNTSPSWSPKGDRIVFSGRQGGKNQIFTISPDSSHLTQLTDRGNNEDPSFSPDGRFIVFTSDRDGDRAVYVMRANGEAQKRITPKGVRAFGPRWSPNY